MTYLLFFFYHSHTWQVKYWPPLPLPVGFNGTLARHLNIYPEWEPFTYHRSEDSSQVFLSDKHTVSVHWRPKHASLRPGQPDTCGGGLWTGLEWESDHGRWYVTSQMPIHSSLLYKHRSFLSCPSLGSETRPRCTSSGGSHRGRLSHRNNDARARRRMEILEFVIALDNEADIQTVQWKAALPTRPTHRCCYSCRFSFCGWSVMASWKMWFIIHCAVWVIMWALTEPCSINNRRNTAQCDHWS